MPEAKLIQPERPKDLPPIGLDDVFPFQCRRDLDCFTTCCQNVSIILTPYDVLRMHKALGIDSTEFLEKYTLSAFTNEQKLPLLLLRMDPETLRCPFVSDTGCAIYQDRPWACRMYPLGLAEPRRATPEEQPFHFLMQEDLCHGHECGNKQTVRQWLDGQGMEQFEAMEAPFKKLMLHEFWQKGEPLPDNKAAMTYMAFYDLDRFRRFVFESRFLLLFDVDEARVEAIRADDEELLDFAMEWLQFVLLGARTMKLRPEVREQAGKTAVVAAAAAGE
jgi:Fe-S-cluster containining protein